MNHTTFIKETNELSVGHSLYSNIRKMKSSIIYLLAYLTYTFAHPAVDASQIPEGGVTSTTDAKIPNKIPHDEATKAEKNLEDSKMMPMMNHQKKSPTIPEDGNKTIKILKVTDTKIYDEIAHNDKGTEGEKNSKTTMFQISDKIPTTSKNDENSKDKNNSEDTKIVICDDNEQSEHRETPEKSVKEDNNDESISVNDLITTVVSDFSGDTEEAVVCSYAGVLSNLMCHQGWILRRHKKIAVLKNLEEKSSL
ncbi:uncharacterized protein LOC128200032 [Galleria mellonella]|uniref:Uncharacterized protein LOC128200032 n=1 Tax=Galleria mellonella TaxID=7137 RepID=A0ABM3M922_GALME|nr:uncharacterized protein LOC128200032 [Galleria mellonella]